jgi:hypothetical protein
MPGFDSPFFKDIFHSRVRRGDLRVRRGDSRVRGVDLRVHVLHSREYLSCVENLQAKKHQIAGVFLLSINIVILLI